MNKPEINILELTSEKIIFSISNIDFSIANGLRRIMISDIPIIAIDSAEFRDNTTCLIDEFILHRLGMIPIKSFNSSSLLFKKDCNCDIRCNNCSVSYDLKIENNSEKDLNIYSKDLKINNSYEIDENNIFEPVLDDILIGKIAPGQKLDLTCYASKGLGKEHAKYTCVCPVSYKFDQKNNNFIFEIESNGSLQPEDIFSICLERFIDKLNII